MKKYNSEMNIHFPQQQQYQQQHSNDQTPLIMGLTALCLMLLVVIFGMLILITCKF